MNFFHVDGVVSVLFTITHGTNNQLRPMVKLPTVQGTSRKKTKRQTKTGKNQER